MRHPTGGCSEPSRGVGVLHHNSRFQNQCTKNGLLQVQGYLGASQPQQQVFLQQWAAFTQQSAHSQVYSGPTLLLLCSVGLSQLMQPEVQGRAMTDVVVRAAAKGCFTWIRAHSVTALSSVSRSAPGTESAGLLAASPVPVVLLAASSASVAAEQTSCDQTDTVHHARVSTVDTSLISSYRNCMLKCSTYPC